MTSAQARRAFIRHMKEVLLPLGFSQYERRSDRRQLFLKIVPDVVLLVVAFDAPRGFVRIEYAAMPCCMGIDCEDKIGASKEVLMFPLPDGKKPERIKVYDLPYDEQLAIQFEYFEKRILPLMNGIDSVEKLYEFQNVDVCPDWFPTKMMTCCQMKRYDLAIYYLGKDLEFTCERMASERERLAKEEEALARSTRQYERKYIVSWIQDKKERIERWESHISECREEIQRLSSGDTSHIDAVVQSNLMKTAAYFAEAFM